MSRTSTYNTEQRQMILQCFYGRRDKALSIKDILEELRYEKIGRSTVYRQLEHLMNEGILVRHMAEKRGCHVYSLSDKNCAEHFHLKCASCGKVVHLDNEATELMRTNLIKNNFDIEDVDTLILGTCTECVKHD